MSNVKKSERGESKMAFFNAIMNMNEAIIKLLMEDFGVVHNGESKSLKVFINKAKMNKRDSEIFENICKDYNLDIEVGYPLWLVEAYRQEILKTLINIMKHVSFANSTYVNYDFEYMERRTYQNKAIDGCYYLFHIFSLIRKTLNIDINKYAGFAELIQNAINSLKDWRKRNNSMRTQIREEQLRKDEEFMTKFKDKIYKECLKDIKDKEKQKKEKEADKRAIKKEKDKKEEIKVRLNNCNYLNISMRYRNVFIDEPCIEIGDSLVEQRINSIITMRDDKSYIDNNGKEIVRPIVFDKTYNKFYDNLDKESKESFDNGKKYYNESFFDK